MSAVVADTARCSEVCEFGTKSDSAARGIRRGIQVVECLRAALDFEFDTQSAADDLIERSRGVAFSDDELVLKDARRQGWGCVLVLSVSRRLAGRMGESAVQVCVYKRWGGREEGAVACVGVTVAADRGACGICVRIPSLLVVELVGALKKELPLV